MCRKMWEGVCGASSVPSRRKINTFLLVMLQMEVVAGTAGERDLWCTGLEHLNIASKMSLSTFVPEHSSTGLSSQSQGFPQGFIIFEFLGSSRKVMRGFAFDGLLGPLLNSVLQVCLTSQTKNLGDHPAAFGILG